MAGASFDVDANSDFPSFTLSQSDYGDLGLPMDDLSIDPEGTGRA